MGVPDKERPLNQRGLSDASLMSGVLRQEECTPELLYVSAAKRTTQTADIISNELNIPQKQIIYSPELYLCSSYTMEETITFAPQEFNKIAIVGHNPTISDIASHYSRNNYIDMPTLGIFIATFDTEEWENVSSQNIVKQQLFIPKMFK